MTGLNGWVYYSYAIGVWYFKYACTTLDIAAQSFDNLSPTVCVGIAVICSYWSWNYLCGRNQ